MKPCDLKSETRECPYSREFEDGDGFYCKIELKSHRLRVEDNCNMSDAIKCPKFQDMVSSVIIMLPQLIGGRGLRR